jgi:hypothetical protein
MIDRQTGFLRGVRRWQPFLLLLGGAIWTFGTAAVAGLWTYYTYNSDRRERSDTATQAQRNLEQTRADTEKVAAETRKLEAQRPFLQKKLDVYFESVQVAGRLTQIDLAPSSDEWKDNARRFWALRWSELEMVGDAGIREAARRVGEQLDEVENDPNRDRHDLRWMVECLSDELRLSLEHSWGYQADLYRVTVTGAPAAKLPRGCVSGREKPTVFAGMLPFKAESNQGPHLVLPFE